jgi:ureidoglycolate lyase
LRGVNEAVGGDYVLGYRDSPGHVHLWHCNYHPDGGQFFWPIDGRPFVVPAGLPGEDPDPATFVGFWSDGSFGIYLHPDVWHEGPFPTAESGRYFDKQGKVHGRVSCDLRSELGLMLNVSLPTTLDR